ncbi:GntR family transcriptional regulator [Orenia metallireducens]|uniref:GntR family transcriptional regulator n=1 Tax=Orenia metallireducens TaxID=1413210 RepID=A0A1C0A952_9FIRM|nr:S1-like domain-containing RNA-binding protein [Orenia metallireducens]OCL26820.1 GntR family transcriptional regulator [Orenia metallireducens]
MKIGRYNEGKVVKETDFGLYLEIDGEEVLLPNKYIPENTEIDDNLNVFIYKDSEDRPIATTLTPKAGVGDYAYLEVKDVTRIGAFLDWGLEKDLLVPYREQPGKMKKGKSYVVRVYLDEETDRIVATEKFDRFINHSKLDVSENDEVDILIYRYTDLGVEVIVNNKYYGLVYSDDIYKNLKIGQRYKGYIKKVREDNKIDVSLRKPGYGRIEDAKDKILKKLKKEEGFISLNDNSSPHLIKKLLQMSKGTFKKAIGGLYKEEIIDITDEGIKLRD